MGDTIKQLNVDIEKLEDNIANLKNEKENLMEDIANLRIDSKSGIEKDYEILLNREKNENFAIKCYDKYLKDCIQNTEFKYIEKKLALHILDKYFTGKAYKKGKKGNPKKIARRENLQKCIQK